MSREDIIQKVEKAISDILSDKYEAKIKVKFRRDKNNESTSRVVRKKQILYR